MTIEKTKYCFVKLAYVAIFTLFSVLIPSYSPIDLTDSVAEAAKFDNYEIRVIRPRYFSKRKRFELGVNGSVVTNQTFIYTYLGSLNLTYHFSEQIGIEFTGAYGFSVDKDDKRVLDSENFAIKTQIIRTQSLVEAALLYTPIYGKYQLTSGRLIYFDTFLAFGIGQSGVDYQYDHCLTQAEAPPGVTVEDPPQATVVSYPTFTVGLGQRFFLNKTDGIKWDVRDHIFSYDRADGSCPGEEGLDVTQHSVTMQMGLSRFF